MRRLYSQLKSQRGQGTVEYALLTLAIVAIIVAVLFVPGNPLTAAINSAFNRASNAINTANVGA